MDVVYLVKESKDTDSLELRYSLRSLANIPHGKVYIVGEKPEWATNVEYLPVPQDKSKPENWTANLLRAVNDPDISEDFIMMNDDFFIMHQMEDVPALHFGLMKSVIADFDRRYPEGSMYIENMKQLYKRFRTEGLDNPLSYELHTPMVLNKAKVRELYADPAYVIPYHFRTLYGNKYQVGGKATKDFKLYINPAHNDPEFLTDPQGFMSRQPFLSVNGGSFKDKVIRDFLDRAFTDKSPYEI